MDGPLFPEGAGEVLHAILNPGPAPGPPYTHMITAPPGWKYDDEGEPIRPLFYPMLTITGIPQESLPTWASAPASPSVAAGTQMNPLLLDHNVDRRLR